MRYLNLILLSLVAIASASASAPEAHRLSEPFPKGCMLHAAIFLANYDDSRGTAEIEVVKGGGLASPHALVVIRTPEGETFIRDEFLGVFEAPKGKVRRAYFSALRREMRRGEMVNLEEIPGGRSKDYYLKRAFELLSHGGYEVAMDQEAVCWTMNGKVYVYDPEIGTAVGSLLKPTPLTSVIAQVRRAWASRGY